MANDFTPGPWSITDRGDLFRIRNDNDEVVATTDDGGHPVDEIFDYATQEANARLIAKAPDMARLIADIEESLTADGTYRLLREACQKMLREISGEQVSA